MNKPNMILQAETHNAMQVLLSIISIWISWHILSPVAIRVLITPLKCHLTSLLVKSGKNISYLFHQIGHPLYFAHTRLEYYF